tara:strand:+ start:680 stop:1756 length:1077 start_codon:yes stop_codon:yes gene_type:complete
VVKRKRSVKKKPTTTELAPGLDVEFLDEVPNFSELLASWTSEAGKSIPKMPQTILEFVKNMGVKSRKNSKGETQDVKAPVQEYINRAASAGAEESYTPEQIAAVKSLRDYLKENNTDSSKINPQNIKYNSIAGYDRAGKVLAPVDVYGDYRTRKFVNYQKRFKDRTYEQAPSNWIAKEPGKAKVPVWQALFAESQDDLQDFKHPSLLMICNDVLEAFESGKAKARNTRRNPFNLTVKNPKMRGEAAKWVYENIPTFKTWFDSKINNPSYVYRTGNINAKKLQREILNTKLPLNDDESKKIQSWLQTDLKVDLEEVYLKISVRQLNNMAEIAGFKNKKTEEKVEKQDFSDWRQIVKMVQ